MVLGGGAMFWSPKVWGRCHGTVTHTHWIMPHVRPWPPHHHHHHYHPHPPIRPWRAPVEVERMEAQVSVARQVATTTLIISLKNPGGGQEEGQAILPVPAGAMFKSFAMEGGKHEIKAELLPRDEARKIYDSIVRQLKDPALLEFAGLGAVKSSVFPVPARSTVRLKLVYEELLEAEGERIDYVLPRSESLDSKVPWKINVRWQAKGGLAGVYSPSHEIEKRKLAGGTIEAKVRDGKTPGPFRLSAMRRGKDGMAASLLAHPDENKKGGWFLLLMTPPERTDSPALKRELTLVIDRSGSMAGEKLDQARAAALQVVEGLDDGEWFNLIVYNEAVESFAREPVKVNRGSVREARDFINGLRVSGGTNIHGALEEAVSQPPRDGTLPIVLFLTDGLPTIGETSEKRIRDGIAKKNKAKRRIFTFGVGTDVNTPLLSRLADDSRATASYVLPGEDVEVEVARVFRRLAGPALSSPELTALGKDGKAGRGRTNDVIPARLPDFFADDQVVVTGRWSGKGTLKFRLTGNDGEKERKFTFEFKAGGQRNPFVPRLWATRKIAVLTEALRDFGADGEKPDRNDPRVKELVEEIVRLSTEHGVLSEYTAFLARDGAAFHSAARREAAAADFLQTRAMESRSGAASVNQDANLWKAKQAAYANPSNRFLNSELKEEEVAGVQQFGDKAFYRRGDEWVDASILQQAAGDADEVEIGSAEFGKLVDQLVAEGRQSCLALGANARIQVGEKSYVIK
jgi:Ca-activated chloride channel family protein